MSAPSTPDTARGSSSTAKPVKMDLTTGSIARHLTKLSGNMLMGFVSVMGANLMETVYVGRLGTQELAAVSFTFPATMILQGICMGLCAGAASVVARTVGQGDLERLHRLFTHCLLLVVGLAACLSGLVYVAAEFFFRLLQVPEAILPLAVSYLQTWLTGLPLFAVAMVGALLMRAMGDARRPGYLMILGSVVHIVLGYVLVFGLGPVPSLGVAGAALSFVLGRLIAAVGYFYCFWRDRLLLASLEDILSSLRSILHVGLPAAASNLIGPMSMGVITRLLAGHGPEVVAGFGVGSRIEAMLMMLLTSVSMSIAPLVGQNWGAREFGRVQAAVGMVCRFALAWGLIAFLSMVVFGETVAALVNDDPKVVATASAYLHILCLGMGLLGVILNITQSFNALGKPMPPLVLSISQMLVLYVPLALIADRFWGATGIFGAATLTNVVLGVVAWLWFNHLVESGRRAALAHPA